MTRLTKLKALCAGAQLDAALSLLNIEISHHSPAVAVHEHIMNEARCAHELKQALQSCLLLLQAAHSFACVEQKARVMSVIGNRRGCHC